jgi:hypothetical protein
MPQKVNEGRVLLAIQATKSPHKLFIRRAAQLYDVTLTRRIHGSQPRAGRRDKQRPLTPIEEEELVRYVLDLDSRGLPPRIEDVRDIANLLRATRRKPPVGKRLALPLCTQ